MKVRTLEQGTQSVESARGHSSHNHNPFIMLRRPGTGEEEGEVLGFSLVYSGNFLAQAEVDTWDTTRVTLGINPFGFDWKLAPGERFQTPEAVMVYSEEGLNGMSQTFHRLYQRRLARGYWRDRPRPVLNNNWEATYFDFTEDRLVEIAARRRSAAWSCSCWTTGGLAQGAVTMRGSGTGWRTRSVCPGALPGWRRGLKDWA